MARFSVVVVPFDLSWAVGGIDAQARVVPDLIIRCLPMDQEDWEVPGLKENDGHVPPGTHQRIQSKDPRK